jgi:hypothetical protein
MRRDEASPLARASARRARLAFQALIALALGAAGAAAAIAGLPTGVALGIAGALAGAVLLIGAAIAKASVEQQALDELLEQGRRARAPEVVALREQLERPAVRRNLARSLRRAVDAADEQQRLPRSMHRAGDLRHLSALRCEIEEVADALQADDPVDVRGVALAERLVRDGAGSPLYGGDGHALRRELDLIRSELGARRAA